MDITDQELLATVTPGTCLLPELQVAHDRMLLCIATPDTDEYSACWKAYKDAGGDLTMRDPGIDLDNWKRHQSNPYNAVVRDDMDGWSVDTADGTIASGLTEDEACLVAFNVPATNR